MAHLDRILLTKHFTRGISTATLSEVTLTNSNPLNGSSKNFEFKNGITRDKKKEMTQTYKNTFGVKVTVEIGGTVHVPLLLDVSSKVSTEVSYQYETMKSETGSTTVSWPLTWTESGPLKPQMAIHCQSKAFTGEFDATYVSTVEITMANGRKFQIKQPGQFSSTGWSSAFSNCKEMALKDAPPGSTEADDIKGKRVRQVRHFIS